MRTQSQRGKTKGDKEEEGAVLTFLMTRVGQWWDTHFNSVDPGSELPDFGYANASAISRTNGGGAIIEAGMMFEAQGELR